MLFEFAYYVTKMSETFGFKEEDVYALTTNEEYLNELIKKYWFITEDILNKDLYYPLEGYLYPSTYEFYANSFPDFFAVFFYYASFYFLISIHFQPL